MLLDVVKHHAHKLAVGRARSDPMLRLYWLRGVSAQFSGHSVHNMPTRMKFCRENPWRLPRRRLTSSQRAALLNLAQDRIDHLWPGQLADSLASKQLVDDEGRLTPTGRALGAALAGPAPMLSLRAQHRARRQRDQKAYWLLGYRWATRHGSERKTR